MKLLILICLVLASSSKPLSKDKNGEPGRDGEMINPHENNIQKEVNLNPTKLADYNELENTKSKMDKIESTNEASIVGIDSSTSSMIKDINDIMTYFIYIFRIVLIILIILLVCFYDLMILN